MTLEQHSLQGSTTHTVEKSHITSQMALYIHSYADTDSTNCRLCLVLQDAFIEKSLFKWIHIIQIHAIQAL